MRWLVGDIQGCARELDQLLAGIRFDPSRDELWCLGDLVNRGPDSLAVLRTWRDVGGNGILGNHDVHALLVRAGRRSLRKSDTLDALFAAGDADDLLDRLQALPLLVHLPAVGNGPEAWAVHAGLRPDWHDLPQVARRINGGPHEADWLASPDTAFATRVRCCTPEGEMCRDAGVPWGCDDPARPWDELYTGATLVVHGHWATRGHYRGPRTLGLDSGCVYGGMLTAWCQDEDRIVQIPSGEPRAF